MMYEEQLMDVDGEQQLPPQEYEVLAESAMELTEAHLARWRRPPLPDINPRNTSITLQWLDVDMTMGKRLDADPADPRKQVPGAPTGLVPIIRFYGVTEAGNSVVTFVHGFTPYLYASCPQNFLNAGGQIRRALNERLNERKGGESQQGSSGQRDLVLGVDVEMDKKSILGYTPDDKVSPVMKIYVSAPNLVPSVKRALDEGINVQGFGRLSGLLTFESNVPYVLRFMVDKDIAGAGWIEVPAGTYAVRSENTKESHCQLELDVVHEYLVAHKPEGKWSRLAPLRVLSTDIECQVCTATGAKPQWHSRLLLQLTPQGLRR